MSIGYPDYSGWSIFLKYGAVKSVFVNDYAVSDGIYHSIYNVPTKAKIISGYCKITSVGEALINMLLELIVDGVIIEKDYTNNFINYNLKEVKGLPFNLAYINNSYRDLVVSFNNTISFDDSYEFKIKLIGDDECIVAWTGDLYYQEVI